MHGGEVTFRGANGVTLSARLELPAGPVVAHALFAHCFTCGKASKAAVTVSRALAARGVATLRFDFTGLGGSEGDFANTNFSSNVDDLVAAADFLREAHRAPALLIGHSLGGAAVLAAAASVPECTAVATIGAPFDAAHVEHNLLAAIPAIEADGEAAAMLGGRTFTIRRQFLDDIRAQRQDERIPRLGRALLVMHAPTDNTVGIENATRIFGAARHPKSFVSLDSADHFLSRNADADYAAGVVAAWAARYLPPAAEPAPAAAPGEVVVEGTGAGRFQQRVSLGAHRLTADEPVAAGGLDSGPSPYDLLSAALATCKAMTMRMYAERKGFPLEDARVSVRHGRVHAADCADCETRDRHVDEFAVTIALSGPLDAQTRERIVAIAERCPVHRTLTGEVRIRTAAVPEGAGPASAAQGGVSAPLQDAQAAAAPQGAPDL